MTPREKRILEFIAEAEWKYGRVMPDSLRKKWRHSFFADIHFDRLDRAMTQVMAECKFFPLPAEIREAARKLPPSAAEIAEIEQRRLEREQRLLLGVKLANQRQLAPTRSLVDPPADAPKPAGMTTRGPMSDAEYAARVAELQRQKVEMLRIEAWGKEVTKHAKPIERGVTGAEAEFLLYDPGSGLVM